MKLAERNPTVAREPGRPEGRSRQRVAGHSNPDAITRSEPRAAAYTGIIFGVTDSSRRDAPALR
jgi:hypothetical protein